MAYGKTTGKGKIHYVAGRLTTAEVNAGKVIIPALVDKAISIVGGQMVAIGGAATSNTSVDLQDTAGTPVVGVVCARAGLTQNTQLDFTAASNMTLTTYRAPLTKGKAVKLVNAGSSMTVATHLDYYVEYVYSD